MNLFQARLKELLQAKEKSDMEISKEIGVTKQKLSHWKTGYTEPCMDDLIVLAHYFDISVDYLIGYENEDGTKNDKILDSK